MPAVEAPTVGVSDRWGDWRLGDLDAVLSRATEVLGGWCEVLSVSVMSPRIGLTSPRVVVHLQTRGQAEELIEWIEGDIRVVTIEASRTPRSWDAELEGYDLHIFCDEGGDRS